MQPTQGVGVGEYPVALAHGGGYGIGNITVLHVVQHHRDGPRDRPRGEGPHRRVNGNGTRRDPLDVVPVHPFEGRVGELQLSTVGADLPGKEEGPPRGQEPLDGGELVVVVREESRREELRAIGELGLQANTGSAAVGHQMRRCDLGQDRHVLSFAQRGHRGEATPVIVAARRDRQQLSHRPHSGALTRLHRLLRKPQRQRHV